jgi:hypothetical protein
MCVEDAAHHVLINVQSLLHVLTSSKRRGLIYLLSR